ncbi:hypothetical protein [Pseudoalteromonas phage Cr39582]|uniref:Uncharacterized protein n=1 Tax=Pseudoalteromonas phage Cr39582 TaxID=2099852 RepID=A0A2P1CL00_9VIRU|nr:hypothetical protein FDJ46_gp15 [Pseudoalteromonas phage Cr39582]AVJ51879.1 hypothetical protein [Pseudoalteromonas phage Cr39582]
MGLFGGGNSKSTSNQTTNNENTNIATQGDNLGAVINGNGNSVTMTDHGLVDALVDIGGYMSDSTQAAFGAASDMAYSSTEFAGQAITDGFDYAEGINRDSLDMAEGVNRDSLNFGRDALDFGSDALEFGSDALSVTGDLMTDAMQYSSDAMLASIEGNAGLAGQVIDANTAMTGQSLNFGLDTFNGAMDSLNQSNANMAMLAEFTSNQSTDLARDSMAFGADLMAQYQLNVSDANDNATNHILNASKSAMQFADNMSRSDGQQLAKDSNKTLMIGIVAVSAAVGLYAISRG